MGFFAFAENSIQLIPDGTLVLHIALVLLMIFVLNRTLFRPINKVLEERTRRTKTGTGAAQEIFSDVEKKLAHYEMSLREGRAHGYQLLEQERNLALAEHQERIAALRADLLKFSQAEKNLISAQVEQSRNELNREALLLAEQISLTILGRPIRRA